MDLLEAREALNQIDSQLTVLFCQRMEVIKQVALYKQQHGLAVHDPKREAEMLVRLRGLAQNGWQDQVEALYTTILAISRDTQRALGA